MYTFGGKPIQFSQIEEFDYMLMENLKIGGRKEFSRHRLIGDFSLDYRFGCNVLTLTKELIEEKEFHWCSTYGVSTRAKRHSIVSDIEDEIIGNGIRFKDTENRDEARNWIFAIESIIQNFKIPETHYYVQDGYIHVRRKIVEEAGNHQFQPKHKIKCRKCGTTIFSRRSGELVKCDCGLIGIDETEHYCRVLGDLEAVEEE